MNLENIISFNKVFDKSEIRNLISWFLNNYGSIRTKKFLDRIKEFGLLYATTTGLSLGLDDLKIPPSKLNLVKISEDSLARTERKYRNGLISLSNCLQKENDTWNIINQTLKNDGILNLRQSDYLNSLYAMTLSGARGSIAQVKQLIAMRGLVSDSQGNLITFPIKSNFKEGLNIVEYFVSCYGARKGLIDTALKTANAGYLTRRLIYTVQGLIIKKPNCFTTQTNLIILEKQTKQDFKLLKSKLIGRVVSETIKNENTGEILISNGQDICNVISIRTPLNCKLIVGLCQVCYGWNLSSGKMVELGECIGILAAQSIGEPGTQLTMRTFHTGGIFSAKAKEAILAPFNGKIWYNLGRKFSTKFKEKAFLTLHEKKIVIYQNDYNKSIFYLPANTILFTKPGKIVFDKQIIAQKLDSTSEEDSLDSSLVQLREIKASLSGQIYTLEKNSNHFPHMFWVLNSTILTDFYFLDKILHRLYCKVKKFRCENKFKKKQLYYTNQKRNLKKKFPKLNINIRNLFCIIHKSKKMRSESGLLITFKFPEKNVIMFRKLNKQKNIVGQFKVGSFVKKGCLINNFKNLYSSQVIQEKKNISVFRKVASYYIKDNTLLKMLVFPFIKKDYPLYKVNFKTQKIEDIVQGLPKVEQLLEARKTSSLNEIKGNLHELLKNDFDNFQQNFPNNISVRKSFDVIQKYLIRRVQAVYESQGVKINDKHLELIVKQMTSKVLITNVGDSSFIVGDFLDLNQIEKMNDHFVNKVVYEPIIMGITRLSLSNQSFIAQASFQETTKVLTRSALQGKIDWLYGLKENLVFGNIIPAGTGFKIKK
uniref:DNA-directed RNA polymerase n=1 Tax=Euglena hiemalis TaxID=392896 RepID=A0A345UC19_9EUGL|nr:RNA polymerase beta subunit [Euglena hiemalis]AXI98005.1 RNA polymerase beta subunit [Euglena hiemalis]